MTTPFLDSVHALIEEKSLLKHPFYALWTKGQLTMDHMKIYALEYFHLAKAVPEVVAEILARVPDEEVEMRRHVAQNMQEETEHVELWRRFAHSMDITDAELDAYVPTQTVQDAVTKLKDLAKKSLSDGIIAMYAFESDLPKIAATKKEGLIAFYGLTSEDAQCYFDAHLLEEEHLKVWRAMIVDENTAMSSAMESLVAQNRVLDGVCEKAGIMMAC